jgi:hypothetical protein
MNNRIPRYVPAAGLVLIAAAAALAGVGAVVSALAVLAGGALTVAAGWTIVRHAPSRPRP